MLFRVRIRELLSASLLEAPPNVNTSEHDDNKLQNYQKTMTKKKGKAAKIKERSRCQNDEMKDRMRIR